jgi:hypothetical protein
MHTTKRYVAALTGVVAALAIAAPITDASAATTPAAFPGSEAAAVGPTLIGSVFNGATVIQVVNGPAEDVVRGTPTIGRGLTAESRRGDNRGFESRRSRLEECL